MDFDQTQVIDDFELEEAESEEENKVRSKKIEVSLKKFRRITMHSLSATITFRTFQRHSCWRALFLLVCWFPFVSFRIAIQEIGRTWPIKLFRRLKLNEISCTFRYSLVLKGTVTPPLCVCELGGGGVGERVKRDILESKE